jgi:hypothetical protein
LRVAAGDMAEGAEGGRDQATANLHQTGQRRIGRQGPIAADSTQPSRR